METQTETTNRFTPPITLNRHYRYADQILYGQKRRLNRGVKQSQVEFDKECEALRDQLKAIRGSMKQ